MKTALRPPASAMRGRLRSSCTLHATVAAATRSRRPVQSSTDARATMGSQTAGAASSRPPRLYRRRTTPRQRAAAQPLRAAHPAPLSRPSSRSLPPGLPDRAAIARAGRAAAGRGPCARRAMRVARQLTLERLAVLDVEAGASLGRHHAGDDRARRGDARARPGAHARRPGRALRRAARRRRRADRLLDRRHGQARRARAQRLVRHRPRSTSTRQTARPTAPEPVSAHEYFSQVARGLYALIGDVTEDGFVFRVDLALRPNGNSGPPVASLAMLEEYLQAHGREWERFAWLKSRVVAPRASVDQRPRARPQVAGHRVRLSPLSRLRRLRGPAPAAPARCATRRSGAPPAGPSAPTTSSSRAAASARSSSSSSCCWSCAAASFPRSAPARP